MQDFGATQLIVPGEYIINCDHVADMPLTTFTLNGMDFDITGPELVIEVSQTAYIHRGDGYCREVCGSQFYELCIGLTPCSRRCAPKKADIDAQTVAIKQIIGYPLK